MGEIILKEGEYKGISYTISVDDNDYGILRLETLEGKRASTSGRILYELLTADGFVKHADHILRHIA